MQTTNTPEQDSGYTTPIPKDINEQIQLQNDAQLRVLARAKILLQEEKRLRDEANPKKRRKLNIIQCSICLEKLPKKQKEFLCCAHFYHKRCINKWLERNSTCPECRIPVWIQTPEQFEEYQKFVEEKRSGEELFRRNIASNDNNLSLMFLRDPELFPMDLVEDEEYEKINAIAHMEEEGFLEMYAHLLSEEDEEYDEEYQFEALLQYEAEARYEAQYAAEIEHLPMNYLD